MTFIRYGDLSPVKQKNRFIPKSKILNQEDFGFFGTFHRPPCRRGNYVFLENIIEMFLVSWKFKDKRYIHPKKFNYEGKIWTHIFINNSEITYYRKRDSWYETDTKSLPIILKKYKWNLNKEETESKNKWYKGDFKSFSDISKAYKIYSKDNMEFFIERIK